MCVCVCVCVHIYFIIIYFDYYLNKSVRRSKGNLGRLHPGWWAERPFILAGTWTWTHQASVFWIKRCFPTAFQTQPERELQSFMCSHRFMQVLFLARPRKLQVKEWVKEAGVFRMNGTEHVTALEASLDSYFRAV